MSFRILKEKALQTHPGLSMLQSKAPYFYECYLPMVVYRLNWVNTMYQALEAVRIGAIAVNHKVTTQYLHFIMAGDSVIPNELYRLMFIYNIRILLRKSKLLANTPEYLLYFPRMMWSKLWRFPFYGEAPYYYPFGAVMGPAYVLHYF